MNQLTVLSAATLFAFAAGVSAGEQVKPAAGPAIAPTVELAGGEAVKPDAGFAALDKDGDASLLQTDFPITHDLSTDLFAAFDTNKDQRLSSAEYGVYAGSRADDDSAEDEEEEAE